MAFGFVSKIIPWLKYDRNAQKYYLFIIKTFQSFLCIQPAITAMHSLHKIGPGCEGRA